MPVYILSFNLIFSPKKQAVYTFKNIVKSCLFLAAYVASFRYFLCFFKNTRGKIDRWNVILSTFFCGFALYFEHKSRRNEIVMYMLPRVLESVYRLLMERGLVKAVKFGEVLVFAFSMSLIMYCYQNKPD